MEKPEIKRENVDKVYDGRFVRVMDLNYAPGKHYLVATRRDIEDLTTLKSDAEFRSMLPDAVTIFPIVRTPGEEPRLLLNYEYRYPAGQFLLSPPAGLTDPEDRMNAHPLFETAVREILEETGIKVKASDRVFEISPLVFSTPGMSDESNALVGMVLDLADLSCLKQTGAVGTECFNGFETVTKEEARVLLREGRDKYGNYYSMYTWAAMMYFVSDMWEGQEDER